MSSKLLNICILMGIFLGDVMHLLWLLYLKKKIQWSWSKIINNTQVTLIQGKWMLDRIMIPNETIGEMKRVKEKRNYN